MSDLSFIEKQKLEKLFGMSSGYVLDFSNRTFGEFLTDSIGQDIFAGKYDYASGSKANRLRRLWEIEPNHVVGKVLSDLLNYVRQAERDAPSGLIEDCAAIVERLRQGAPVLDLHTASPELGERAFQALAKSVKQAIDANEPEAGLDHLHTYVVKYVRSVCERRGIAITRDKPLHSLVGEYVKYMKAAGLIESEMTERILRSSISIMEAFNRVRNEQSLAHDNPILSYPESLLIFSHVVSSIRFIEALEQRSDPSVGPATASDKDGPAPF